jgi:hypothetical protein
VKPGLFVYDLNLFVDHLAGEAIDRHVCRAEAWHRLVYPVTLFPFYYKPILRLVAPGG